MKILNRKRLERRLAAMPEATRIEIRAAMEQSAAEIVETMQRMAPVDEGDLRDSIAWTWGDAPAGALVIARTRKSIASKAGLTLTIYAGGGEQYYARFVEFGTVNMTAQPFFFPSWRLGRRRVKGRVARAVTKAAKKVAAGG